MKATFLMAMLATILVLTGIVSATFNQCGFETTVVDGTIYQAGGNPNDNPIEGADVVVTCKHGGVNYTSAVVQSDDEGHYAVNFPANQCDLDDEVTVSASLGEISNEEQGEIEYSFSYGCRCRVNIGVVDVPLIPEFGILLGGLTIAGALIAFFVIRRQ
jgi:hypothetical protein